MLTALPPPQAFVDEARDELVKMQVLHGEEEAEPLPDLPGFKDKVSVQEEEEEG